MTNHERDSDTTGGQTEVDKTADGTESITDSVTA